ncbi:hypothetical protein [Saccharopolyspora phatthalungensis]|uniref:Uncharacterized protein n=1 Tax=Saccharopolyspora phatthalungensis TaxID=664693 RepID=A0A840QF69_9PSEU|nr:hypothetical protein [Saccharopolyspora phatthalungensis]MBB5158550.1 hypothetical protein [Saccharopolyspora phatthalungensis]
MQRSDGESSLTCVMAAAVLDGIYRSLDQTYASLGMVRWNQPPAEAIWQARRLEDANVVTPDPTSAARPTNSRPDQ